jgi:hypothetical protein
MGLADNTRVFVPLVVPVLTELGVRETARRTGHSVAAVSAALAGRSRSRQAQLERYLEVASEPPRASLERAASRHRRML